MGYTRLHFPDDHVLFPARAFFNAVADYCFVDTMKCLLCGVSYGTDYASCDFPDLEEGDCFDGVKFSLFDDEVVVEYVDFINLVEYVCSVELRRRPELKLDIGRLFLRADVVRCRLVAGKGYDSFVEESI